MKYLALLRGINVGGNNIIKKDELKAYFEAAGLNSVLTYIQSGNVLFSSKDKNKTKMAQKIQEQLKKKLKNEIQIVILTEKEYTKALKTAHKSWGVNKNQKHNALFLLDEMSSTEAQKNFPKTNNEYEEVSFSHGIIFWSGSKEHYAKTGYAKDLVKSPLYKKVTIRNSNTSMKLKDMFEEVTEI